MPAVLEFEEIAKEYKSLLGRRRVAALQDFSLRVEAGEIFGFLGPNGAGKTTAIHLAMGFMRPTSGRGRMLGRPFGDAHIRRRVGFLAENVALYHRRADRLLSFYGGLNGISGNLLRGRVREVLDDVRMFAEFSKNVGKFSRGMLQRIGLAQALINDPELLILDEPTSALDPIARVMVRELLLTAKAAGKTIFLSSHLLSEVELVCDRVAIVAGGKIRRIGQTAELLESKNQLQIVCKSVNYAAFSGATVRDGLVSFAVENKDQRQAIEKVWSMGGEIVSVNPLRRSLEEIFLEVANEAREREATT